MRDRLVHILRDCTTFLEHANRKTVTVSDVIFALKRVRKISTCSSISWFSGFWWCGLLICVVSNSSALPSTGSVRISRRQSSVASDFERSVGNKSRRLRHCGFVVYLYLDKGLGWDSDSLFSDLITFHGCGAFTGVLSSFHPLAIYICCRLSFLFRFIGGCSVYTWLMSVTLGELYA